MEIRISITDTIINPPFPSLTQTHTGAHIQNKHIVQCKTTLKCVGGCNIYFNSRNSFNIVVHAHLISQQRCLLS